MLTIEEIRERITPICRQYGVKRAYLFGSYARGEANENSDVDLRIEKGKIEDLFQLSGFRIDVVEALGTEVDLLSVLPEPEYKKFRENLRRDEILLYEDTSDLNCMLTIEEIREKLIPVARKHKIEEIYLFGSYARGEAKEDSDVDLLLKAPKSMTYFALAGFIVDAENALGKAVDYVLEDEMILNGNEYLATNIKKDRLLLLGAKELQ